MGVLDFAKKFEKKYEMSDKDKKFLEECIKIEGILLKKRNNSNENKLSEANDVSETKVMSETKDVSETKVMSEANDVSETKVMSETRDILETNETFISIEPTNDNSNIKSHVKFV